jgi:hypothetical protein
VTGGGHRAKRAAAVLGLITLLIFPGLGGTVVPAEAPPFASDPTLILSTKLEKTIFQVDVLTLEIRLGPESGPRLHALADQTGDRTALADSVTRIVLTAPRAWVRMEFLRATGQRRFLDGIQSNMRKARDAGIMTGEHYRDVSRDLPVWYDFLRRRGVHKGDLILYEIQGDTLQTTYRGDDGSILLDLTQHDPQAREGVLGSFLAPGSDFRDGLVRSFASGR